MKAETVAAQALGWVDERTRAVAPALYLSSTFQRDPDNQYRSGRNYARADNPAFDQPQAVLAALEKGAEALLFASGMAAATSVFQALSQGDHVVAPKVMYWSLRNWIASFVGNWGLAIDFVDMSDLDAVKLAVRERTKLVWVETPSNPLWQVTDLSAVAEIAHSANAKLAVDSTVVTPVLTRPIEY